MAQLGFVGLGKMGGRVAKRLLDAGHTVTGYNRTKSKAQWLLDAGMQWGESPRQVAEGAEVTFSMVTNTATLHEVFNGHDGILATLVKGSPPDFRDPLTRSLGHFDDAQMPPSSQLPMEGYRGSSIVGISLKMLVDQMLGAQHLTLFLVEFQPGGEGKIHDHPFEETYVLLSGEAEAILDGKTYQVKAGDSVWTGVGGTHGFFNKGTIPVRWIETQAPQPPKQQGLRFPAEWASLAEQLDDQDFW